jgi:hypothetical protein
LVFDESWNLFEIRPGPKSVDHDTATESAWDKH